MPKHRHTKYREVRQTHTSKNKFTLRCSHINVCVVVCDVVSVVNYTVLSVWITETLSSLTQKRTVPKYARETAGGLWAPVLTRAVSDLSICHQYQKDNKWGRGERERKSRVKSVCWLCSAKACSREKRVSSSLHCLWCDCCAALLRTNKTQLPTRHENYL